VEDLLKYSLRKRKLGDSLKGFSNLALFLILAFFGSLSFLPSILAIECVEQQDPSFEIVLECVDTIDTKKETMEMMYADVNRFSNSFEGAKVKGITTDGDITYATLEVPLPLVSNLQSKVKFTQSQDYLLEFLEGNLAGSSLAISLSTINGYDGTKDGGTEVNLVLMVKETPCFAFGLKCGTVQDFEYVLDKGLYLLELESKKLTGNSNMQNSHDSEGKLSKTEYPLTEQQMETDKVTSTTFAKNDSEENLYPYAFDSCGLNNKNTKTSSNLIECNDLSLSVKNNESGQFPSYWMDVSTKWYLAGLITEREYQNGLEYLLKN
jgi:hypothetical protein